VFLQEDEQYQYEDSRHKEVVGLLEKGVFEVAHDVLTMHAFSRLDLSTK
jgi:hypothetical protein